MTKIKKRGISGIVATVLMIALVLAIAVIVWGVVRNLVEEQITNVGSCLDVYDKVNLNNKYTCYDSQNSLFRFSVSIGNIDMDKVIISISSEGTTNSYELTSTDQTALDSYPTGQEVTIPGKNSGKTYTLSTTVKPDLIKISPVINGQQCESSDSLSDIDECI